MQEIGNQRKAKRGRLNRSSIRNKECKWNSPGNLQVLPRRMKRSRSREWTFGVRGGRWRRETKRRSMTQSTGRVTYSESFPSRMVTKRSSSPRVNSRPEHGDFTYERKKIYETWSKHNPGTVR